MPNFELGHVKSSFNLLGSLCGSDSTSIPVIESRSGSLVVVFKGNLGPNSLTYGFNASFVVNQCPDSCTGNRYCHSNGTHEICVCKPGWTGTACDDIICPANCSEALGHGHCDQVSFVFFTLIYLTLFTFSPLSTKNRLCPNFAALHYFQDSTIVFI